MHFHCCLFTETLAIVLHYVQCKLFLYQKERNAFYAPSPTSFFKVQIIQVDDGEDSDIEFIPTNYMIKVILCIFKTIHGTILSVMECSEYSDGWVRSDFFTAFRFVC